MTAVQLPIRLECISERRHGSSGFACTLFIRTGEIHAFSAARWCCRSPHARSPKAEASRRDISFGNIEPPAGLLTESHPACSHAFAATVQLHAGSRGMRASFYFFRTKTRRMAALARW